MRRAIVRQPGAEMAEGERSFLDRQPIDFELAEAQHGAYCQTLRELGCEPLVLPALAGFPDAPFVEDMAIVLPEVAVLTRTGAESRRAEQTSVEQALSPFREFVRIEEPSTLDGGDVFLANQTLFVGQSGRTNHAGLKQLAHLVLAHGFRVKAVEVTEALHLRTGCTWLGGDHLLINRNWINAERLSEYQLIDVDPSEPFAGTALTIGETVMMTASAPRTIERVRAAGYEVREVDITEFEKAEAGLTCLSLVFEA